jgi:hypothetical protein
MSGMADAGDVSFNDLLAKTDIPAQLPWRPFQLAFVLLKDAVARRSLVPRTEHGTWSRRSPVFSDRRWQDGGLSSD